LESFLERFAYMAGRFFLAYNLPKEPHP